MIRIKKLILTLVALLAVTTGAWAEGTVVTWDSEVLEGFTLSNGQSKTINGVTLKANSGSVTPVSIEGLEGRDFAGSNGANSFTFSVAEGTITKIEVMAFNLYVAAGNGWSEPEENFGSYWSTWTGEAQSVNFGTSADGMSKIKFTISEPTAPAGTALTPDATRKVWTLDKMPDGDVELIPEYYPGMLTFGSGAIEGGKLEVVGLTDTTLPAGFEKDEEGNIYVEPGTVIKVKVVPNEGYRLVSLTDGTNDIEVDADGIATITMPDEYADLTLTATFSNEYTVALNAEGLSDEEAAAWKATTGDNDPAALPLENVKYGTEVKVTYTGTRKVIGVKAEKKAAAPTTPAESTVTWNSENISFLQLYEPSAPFTMMGIKLSTSSMSNTADWRNIGIPTNDGLYFDVTTTGGYTFTAPSGKKFTKIEMTVTNANGWTQVLFQSTLGTGWPSGEDAVTVVEDTKKVTWTGTAASTVGLLTDASYFNASPVTSIVFTLADAE